MVTKKTPAKTTSAKKLAQKAPVKKAVKKTVKAAAAAKKTVTSKKTKPAGVRSFRLAANDQPFFVFKITKQTVYWTILLVYVIVVQLWILKIQMDIADLTNQLLNNTMSR